MMAQPDSVKPSQSVAEALDLLVDSLLAEIRGEPVSPDELLARIKASPPDCLGAALDYMRRTGFLDADELNKPALYHALQINRMTGKGNRVLLAERGGNFALHYSPGYNLETPLQKFLMQELAGYPLAKIDLRPEDRRITKGTLVTHPREAAVRRLLAGIKEEKARYARTHRIKPDTLPGHLTIGNFLDLPQEVIGNEKYAAIYKVYGLLRQHGFSPDTGLALR